MPWSRTGMGATTEGVVAGVGELPVEGNAGCSKNISEDEPGSGKGEPSARG
jgi:hypothetical protein